MKPTRFEIPHATLVLFFLLSACSAGDNEVVSPDQTSALQLVDSIQIQETDSRFIGELVDADVERDPLRIFVADRQMRRVAVVAGNGSITRFIGKGGRGPGELGRPVFVSVIRGRIVVGQQRWRGFSVFDTSGAYVDTYRLPSGHWVGGYDLFRNGDGYVMPITSFNPQRNGSLKVPSGESTIATLHRSFAVERTFGAFPSRYQEGEYILQRRTMDVRGDSLAAVGYHLVSDVRLYDLEEKSEPFTKKLSFDHPQFSPPEEETPLDIATNDQSSLYERMSSYVVVGGTFLLRDGIVLQVFANHTEGYYAKTEFSPSEQEYYGTLGTTGSDERLHLHLPGRVLARDESDRLYVELNRTPDERKIGIYEVSWP